MSFNKLNSAFNNTQNSYKYYWWLSIIEISFLERKKEINFDEIVLKIISKLWYPVNYYKLSFGKIDQCSKFIKQIKEKYKLDDNIGEHDLYQFLNEHKDSDSLTKITNELTRYVPYRFIRPWFSEETRGLKDGLVNSKILELQNVEAPYIIDLSSKKIIINDLWFEWLNANLKLIKSYTYYELIKYLENENPNTTNLSRKLDKPKFRNLIVSTKYWKNFIFKEPNQVDVFENKPLKTLEKFSLDHFLPWSFVTHDLIWNLHPTEKTVNSTKNNLIPKETYLNPFMSLQYGFCKFLLNENINKPLESYYTLFNCSKEELNTISKELFIKKMNKLYLPQIEIAKNMGFEYNWSLT